MKLLESLRVKQEKATASDADRQAGLWSEYTEILRRNENPKPGDVDRLAELLALPDMLDANPERDVVVVAELARNRSEAAMRATVEAELAESIRLGNKVLSKIDKFKNERAELLRPNEAREARLTAIKGVEETVERIERQYPGLAGNGGIGIDEDRTPATAPIGAAREQIEEAE